MPPRAAKKAGNAKKAPARGPKGAAKKAKTPPPVVEEKAKVVEAKEEITMVEKTVVEPSKVEVPSQPEPESKPESNESAQVEEEERKEAVEEDHQGERLDLGDDDDDSDYDPEEEVDGDFDEKRIEEEQPLKEANGVEENGEEGEEGDLEEFDMEEEEMEDVVEEIEGDGDGEHIEEEHEQLSEEGMEEEEMEDVGEEMEDVGGGEHVEEEHEQLADQEHQELADTENDKELADWEHKEMKNPVVNGKQCGVTPSQDSDTLFLGNICKTWTKQALKEKLNQYGIDSVEDLTLVEDSNNAEMNRGFAFMKFSSLSDAMDAYKRLQERDAVFGVDRNAKVAFADSFNEPDDAIMAKVKTIFVSGLPASWDEDCVKEKLKEFGEIENVELARNKPSAKRKNFGFVTFDTHDAAVVCAESINNTGLGDGDNKVKVRARLSRPLPNGRGKVTVRSRPLPKGRGKVTVRSRPLPKGRGKVTVRSARGAPRGGRTSRIRQSSRSFPARGLRGGRVAPSRGRGFKGSVGLGNNRPVGAMTERVRPLPPLSRSYRKKHAPSYPSSSKKDFVRRDELPPRSRGAVDERQSSYKVHNTQGSSYSDDVPHISARVAPMWSAYVDESYVRRFERPPLSYGEVRTHDYDSVSGSKRPYSAIEDVPPPYAGPGIHQSRTRLEYGVGDSSSQFADTYSERVGLPQLGYAGSKTFISSHEAYGSRHGMNYAEGSYGDRDVGGAYLSSYGSDYVSRRPDVGDKPYSSLYSSRSFGGSNYMGGGGSGSYY